MSLFWVMTGKKEDRDRDGGGASVVTTYGTRTSLWRVTQ